MTTIKEQWETLRPGLEKTNPAADMDVWEGVFCCGVVAVSKALANGLPDGVTTEVAIAKLTAEALECCTGLIVKAMMAAMVGRG